MHLKLIENQLKYINKMELMLNILILTDYEPKENPCSYEDHLY